MSPAGRMALRVTRRLNADPREVFVDTDNCLDSNEECPDEDIVGLAAGQSETAIAVDKTGQHVVVGFNDFRGFSATPVSVSGFAFSDDGGRTFTDGGQLPSPGNDVVGTTALPQVFGDPDIKYLGDCTFLYVSIIVKKFSDTATVQTLGVHRSTDCGHTWQGPFEVTAASNPSGVLDARGNPTDSSDKELMDVDPDTGRVMITWTNFSAVGPQISSTFSDDVLTAETPTFSPQNIIANGPTDGQGSMPRFAAHGSTDVYVAWSRSGNGRNGIGFAHSGDDGVTWDAPIDLVPNFFFPMDQVLGNDRVHSFPSLAVDNSNGRRRGNVYVAYADNDNHDGADIAFQRSTDHGATFSEPLLLNSRPGADRAQWFPSVAVDPNNGRVHVFYYDQQIATSGDLSESTLTFSNDGGASWANPRPLTRRPFRAGFGNDTGQPNLGDYNASVAQRGELFAIFAQTRQVGFTDGQPTRANLSTPDFNVSRLRADAERVASLSLGDVTFREAGESGSNGNLDPEEIAFLRFPLRNFVTNPLNATTLRGVFATLETSTPGVVILNGFTVYPNLAPDQTADNRIPFIIFLSSSFVPGTPIEFRLRAFSSGGSTTLLHTQLTGTPSTTTILSESFDSAEPGVLPPDWTATHVGGTPTVPWTSRSDFCGASSNAAFHINANDGTNPARSTRFESLLSPSIVVPPDSEYVTLDFDVCFDTEDDPTRNILAFDGLVLRIADVTPGNLARNVLAEAIATEFTTGAFQHYPKHLPRSGNRNYFQDMSAWAGDSQGPQHVHLRLPGMAGTTVQLRFDFTQDASDTCTNVRPDHTDCGVSIDNIVMNSVKSINPDPDDASVPAPTSRR